MLVCHTLWDAAIHNKRMQPLQRMHASQRISSQAATAGHFGPSLSVQEVRIAVVDLVPPKNLFASIFEVIAYRWLKELYQDLLEP